MPAQWLDKTTLSVTELGWTGQDFREPLAQEMWLELPPELQEIALAELSLGNDSRNILRNLDGGFVVLTFSQRPLSPPPQGAGIRVHREYQWSNYCYDGTFCTYEHEPSGCFLAFDDPEYEDDA